VPERGTVNPDREPLVSRRLPPRAAIPLRRLGSHAGDVARAAPREPWSGSRTGPLRRGGSSARTPPRPRSESPDWRGSRRAAAASASSPPEGKPQRDAACGGTGQAPEILHGKHAPRGERSDGRGRERSERRKRDCSGRRVTAREARGPDANRICEPGLSCPCARTEISVWPSSSTRGRPPARSPSRRRRMLPWRVVGPQLVLDLSDRGRNGLAQF